MFAISREQAYIICPACGCSFRRDACTSYLDCEYRTVAVEIAAKLDELIQGRSIPELTPEEMGMLQKNYQELHQKSVEEHRRTDNRRDEVSEMEEKHSVKKTHTLKTDRSDEYGLFE
jgi:hypothetical protein